MLKKLTKVLIINCFIITIVMMLLSTHVFATLGNSIFSIFSKKNIGVTSISPLGATVNLSTGFPGGYYCLDRGKHYDGGLHEIYETGDVDDLGYPELSFVVGEHKRAIQAGGLGAVTSNSDGRNWDPWQNYVWSLNIGDNIESIHPSTFAGIMDKYEQYKNIYDEVVATGSNPLKIVPINPSGAEVDVAAGGTLIADTDNRVKFKIEYPWGDLVNEYYGSFKNSSKKGLLDLVDISISVNGTQYYNSKDSSNINKLQRADGTPFEIGDQEAYILVDDMNYGTTNNIKIDWNFLYYTKANYAKLNYIGDGERFPYQDVLYLKNTMEIAKRSVDIDVTVGQPDFEISFEKIDKLTLAKLAGIQFEISVVNGNVVIDPTNKTLANPHTITTIDGETKILIRPDNTNGIVNEVTVKFKETSVPEDKNYLIYRGELEFIVQWNSETMQWEFNNRMNLPSYQGSSEKATGATLDKNSFKLTAENKPIPNIKLLLDKVDSITGGKIAGVTFNVEVVNGTVVGGSSITTDGSSNTVIEIKPNKDNGSGKVENIIVKLKEVSLAVPNSYLMYLSEIEIEFEWDPNTCDWVNKNFKVPEYQNGMKEKVELNKDSTQICLYTIRAENRPNIQELSGHVWIDEPQGNKHIDPPNGRYDRNERLKAGIEVYLYDADTGAQVTQDGYGNTYGDNGCVITDSNGAYKFENVPKSAGTGYYILFKYDGITYIRTVPGESKADESNRTGFNARFKTISAGQSNDGTSLEYQYDGSSKSTLITQDSTGRVLSKFAIDADTKTAGNIYNQAATNIDLGLRQKEVDLSLMTDLSKATVSINGLNPVSYDYNTIFNGDMSGIINISQNMTADGVNYNLNLYRSDYNYRIGNYLGNNTSISHQPGLSSEEVQALQDSRSELEVELEYVVVLNNQSGVEATVNQFVFMYDSHLTYVGITGGTASDDGGKLMITPSNATLGYAGQTRVVITFKYKLDSESLDNQPKIINRAEILEYSTTEGGYVDCDSAPGNAFESSGFKYEDDSDEARGLVIKATRSEREISGYVFEDNKTDDAHASERAAVGNGTLDSGETKVDDVIVQLIEIKDITIGGTLHRLEYIWQETTSGSSTVRAITADGTDIQSYNVIPEKGKFTFKEFIPGEYIVRFIYGDGTYYDQAINGNNILTYNGQDYKSTVDRKYNKKFLTLADYSSESSMARDNEARRLEVMAYALGVSDGNDLIINSKDKLANTWMAAETSRLIVTDLMVAPGSSEYSARVNFGLVKRPEISLVLRKHITYASLKGGEGNLNAEANIPISAYSDNSTDIFDFNSSNRGTTPITAQATTRTNRGYWQVETNRINGANLTLTYTYRVRNGGETDYLNHQLASKFSLSGAGIETDTQNYINAIRERITAVKAAVKANLYNITDSYLGEAYYTGVKGPNDVEVGAYVHLEDYVKGGFVIDGTSDFAEVSNTAKDIINVSGTAAQETVKVLRTKNGANINANGVAEFKLTITKTGLTASDTASLETLSYIGQVVSPTANLAGSRITGTTPNNLQYVQSYADMATLDNLGTEEDEYWAETFRIVPTTGGDKKTAPIITISIAAGLTVVAVGIVCIKKFIIK